MTDPIAVDISGPNFQLPETTGDGLYQKILPSVITDFTTGSVDGTGSFDKIMAGLSAQLQAQFDAGRITGNEFTKAYIELVQIATSTALQWELQADNSYWTNQTAQIAAITARIGLETARYQYEAAAFNVNTTLPGQAALLASQLIGSDTSNQVAEFQLSTVLPGQVAFTASQKSLVDTQSASATYTLANILPEQKTATHEQAEVQHAQTSDTRLDGVTPVTGLVGEQTKLYSQQIISYQRDAEVKAAKLFSDAWITQKTMDDGLDPPLAYTNTSVNEVLTVIMANNNFGTPSS